MPHVGQKLGKEGNENVKNNVSNTIAAMNNAPSAATMWIDSVLFPHYLTQEVGSHTEIKDAVTGSIYKGTNTESRRKRDKVQWCDRVHALAVEVAMSGKSSKLPGRRHHDPESQTPRGSCLSSPFAQLMIVLMTSTPKRS